MFKFNSIDVLVYTGAFGLVVALYLLGQWAKKNGIPYFFGEKFDKKRIEKFRVFSYRFGFKYSYKPDVSIFETVKSFPLFDISKSRTEGIFHVLEGKWHSIPLLVFYYTYARYIFGGYKGYVNTIIYRELNRTDIPPFFMGPQSVWSELDYFGYKTIKFDTSVFSKKYYLKSIDEEIIKTVFTPQVIKFFEEQRDIPNIEVINNKMLIYSAERIEPEQIDAFLDKAIQIINILENGS